VALVRLSHQISLEIAKVTGPIIREAEKAERKDAVIEDVGEVFAAFGRLRLRLLRLVRTGAVLGIVDKHGRRVAAANQADQERILGIALADMTPAVQEALGAFRAANVELIESIAVQQHAQVLDLVTRAVSSGMRAQTLRGQIQERFRVSRSRAELIARDQILKANSQLTQIRHREAGISEYIWITSSDERVRDMHSDLSGTHHSWTDPPVTNEQGDTNHPGEDYQCRCTASPVLPA